MLFRKSIRAIIVTDNDRKITSRVSIVESWTIYFPAVKL